MKILFTAIFLLSVVLRAETSKDPNDQFSNIGANPNATGMALYYLVDFLIKKEKNEKTTISGFCQIKNPESTALNTPCNNVAVVLNNSVGKEQFKIFAVEGKFKFTGVLEDQKYFLSINSKNLKVPEKKIGPLKGGDQVMLNITYKENGKK